MFTRTTVASAKYLSIVFLIGALAALVAWMVYVAQWNVNVYNKVSSGEITGYPLPAKDELSSARYTICYMATVAAVLIYFALQHIDSKFEKD
jgi:uncharacterized membrane protein YhdT